MIIPMTKRQRLEKTIARYMEATPDVALTINDETSSIEFWDVGTNIKYASAPISSFYVFMDNYPCDCPDCKGVFEA
jgi:hypothetical protein